MNFALLACVTYMLVIFISKKGNFMVAKNLLNYRRCGMA
jgi:hypothetical protein